MKAINVLTLLVTLISNYFSASRGYQDENYQFGYTGYIAPSLDVFLREYDAFDRTVDDFELNQKLLLLLDNPDCWYNQRGQKVILLFNETNFPEEYAILRKSTRLFGSNNRLENDFLVLEEEEEREQYKDFYDQFGDIYNSGTSDYRNAYKETISDENHRYSNLDSYFENKIPIVNDLMSEDLEKEKYKSRIKKLIKMKENILRKMFQTSNEIKNLESSFIMQCNFPECNICNDFRSQLNSKYIQFNKYKHRYRTIISLFKEFVDHSIKFGFEHSFNKNEVSETRELQDYKGKLKRVHTVIKRPGFNLTKDYDIVDNESSNKELKRMLNEAEMEIEVYTQNKQEAKTRVVDQQNEPKMIECTKEKLEELVSGNEKLSLLIRSVKYFIDSLFERSCPKCNIKSFNGFTKFGDIIDTQIRILKYYKSEKDKLEEEIQSCIYFLENKAIELDDDSQPNKSKFGNKYRYLPVNEYNTRLNKIFEKYKGYEKNIADFQKLMYGFSRNSKIANKEYMCNINSSILMNELSNEIMSRIISSEIQKRVYLKRNECENCSNNDCQKCIENSKKLKKLQSNIKAQNKLYNAISSYLELCDFEKDLERPGFKDFIEKDQVGFEYFGKDGTLWSIEKYLSEPFINRVFELDEHLSPFFRAKILERIKLTLQAFIKVLELSSINIYNSKCKFCKYAQCNDCYNRFININDNNYSIGNYRYILNQVNLELDKYYNQIKEANTGFSTWGEETNEWILIRDNSLQGWLPNKPYLILKCDKETYSEALTYYYEISQKRKNLQSMSEHIYTWLIQNNQKFSEYHFSKQVKNWESIWKEKVYYDQVFSYVNRYLSLCVNENQELNRSFHVHLNKKSEIRKLYESFREHSENINHLMEKIKEIYSKGYIECYKISPGYCFNNKLLHENIYERLNSEFQAFKLIRKKLNSYLYDEYLNYYDNNQKNSKIYHKDKYMNRFSKYLNNNNERIRNKKRIITETIEKSTIKRQDILKSPIPGMSKYLHNSEYISQNEDQNIIKLSPKSEYQCSKTEILVLQSITSLLSQNQSRLKLLKELNIVRCKVDECFNCKVRNKFNSQLKNELSILTRVLSTASEQLNQCMLDSEDNFVNKEDIIEFQNKVTKVSNIESSFNADLKGYISQIKDFQCKNDEIQNILNIKQEKSTKIYLWIEEMLIKVQALTDNDENDKNEYIIWTSQVTQLLNFSKVLQDRLQECINTLFMCFDHSEQDKINK